MWYKVAKNLDYVSKNVPTYFDVGHSGFFSGQYGCNHIWVLRKDGEFVCFEETPDFRFHNGKITEMDDLFKGRVDACKKEASIVGIDICSPTYIENLPMNEARCERMKTRAIKCIKDKFGQDIKIIDLYGINR